MRIFKLDVLVAWQSSSSYNITLDESAAWAVAEFVSPLAAAAAAEQSPLASVPADILANSVNVKRP
jgi:hypothetical protein